MKLKDILNESPTDLVARYYQHTDDEETDMRYNYEAKLVIDKNQEYYKKFFEKGATPVFTEHTNFVDPNAEDWNTNPEKDVPHSSGHRGRDQALARAGVPHNKNYQRYDPAAYKQDDNPDAGMVKRN